MVTPDEPEILVRREGALLRITLNRPAAINALTPGMLQAIDGALDQSVSEPGIRTVAIDGAGDRGLCAGGDLKILAGMDAASAERFWRIEYRVNGRIAQHPVPYLAVMDGITMGGGLGVSAHGSVRIVTERSRLAMPEVRIGLAPDVGCAHLLARAPGELGTHLALTAGEFDGSDAIAIGFADHFVPSERLPLLMDAVAWATEPADEVAARFAEPPGTSKLLEQRAWIDECYRGDDVADILERLDGHADPRAGAAAASIRQGSPTSAQVALRAIRHAREWDDVSRTLAQDLRVSTGLFAEHDLHEGIRAQIVDKDRNPHWSPATAAEVRPADVERILTTGPDLWDGQVTDSPPK
jgi:enoyl-CoA hydratase